MLPRDKTAGLMFHAGSIDKGNAQNTCTSGGKDFIIPVCFRLFRSRDGPLYASAMKYFFPTDKDVPDSVVKYANWLAAFRDNGIPICNAIYMFAKICELRREHMSARATVAAASAVPARGTNSTPHYNNINNNNNNHYDNNYNNNNNNIVVGKKRLNFDDKGDN
jgi:hypothetical protein